MSEKKLEDWQQRVVDEKEELDEKADELVAFFDTKEFAGLSIVIQELMFEQLSAMYKYSDILHRRISLF